MYCDLDLGVDIMDQRQDRQTLFMCNANTSKKLKAVCNTRIFDHVYICFDLDPGDMKLDRGNDIL